MIFFILFFFFVATAQKMYLIFENYISDLFKWSSDKLFIHYILQTL